MEVLFDLITRGGWVMYPIVLCSIVGSGLVLERTWALRRKMVVPKNLLTDINRLLSKNLYGEAAIVCQNSDSAAARLISTGLKLSSQKRSVFKESMEEAGRRETAALTRHLGTLYLVASISPLLGLLGTVSGMITAFDAIASQNIVNPGLLAGGISEALLTTASGLCVAIPILVAHRALSSQAENLIMVLEGLSSDLMETLTASSVAHPDKP